MAATIDWESIYRGCPNWAQHALASLHGWRVRRHRYGGDYLQVARAVENRRGLQGQELVAFQGKRLAGHLRAAAQTPFWQVRFAEHDVNPGGSDPFAEVTKLPILSKQEVRQHAAEILNPDIPRRRLSSCHTSGTTGAGLNFWETPQAERERWAIWWRYRHQFGINFETRCGYFGGRSLVPIEQCRPPFWRFNHPGRQLLFSAYHLCERTLEDYWRALVRWRAQWLHGYPSSLSLLAALAEDRRLPPLTELRQITIGAENLLAGQRSIIERVFKVRVRQHYGLAEAVANFSEGLDGVLRVDEDFSLVEFVPLADAPTKFRIVGSNWSNPAFPLLRYDTGDIATRSNDRLKPTDHWRPVETVDGRQEDYVVLPSGAKVGRLDHIFKDLVDVREAQVYQPDLKTLVFRVVKGPGYDAAGEEARLLAEARIRLGKEIGLRLEYVPQIARTETGKLRFVVSEIAGNKLS